MSHSRLRHGQQDVLADYHCAHMPGMIIRAMLAGHSSIVPALPAIRRTSTATRPPEIEGEG
jgi:hypothetical protein